jgi:hypothetical protein
MMKIVKRRISTVGMISLMSWRSQHQLTTPLRHNLNIQYIVTTSSTPQLQHNHNMFVYSEQNLTTKLQHNHEMCCWHCKKIDFLSICRSKNYQKYVLFCDGSKCYTARRGFFRQSAQKYKNIFHPIRRYSIFRVNKLKNPFNIFVCMFELIELTLHSPSVNKKVSFLH